MKKRILFSWSGGKDSILALHEIKMSNDYEITALLTTLTEDYQRISMHGVRGALLKQQAEALGYSLEEVFISKNSSHKEYKSKMRNVLKKYLLTGVSSVVFADIFLKNVRKYREDNLAKLGMKGIFPLWEKDTAKLARNFITLGFKAVVTCVDSKVLDKKFVGRSFNRQFLSELPASVDPCGENGEFHSFVYGGPIFHKEVIFKKGETVLRDNRFYYCDLIPVF